MPEQKSEVSEEGNGPSPEIPRVPEKQERGAFEAARLPDEQAPVKEVKKPEEAVPTVPAPVTAPAPAPVAPPTPAAHKSETLEKIEDIMEEDLEEVYSHLPADKKQEFRKKGEETAEEIEGMLFRVKINSKKIFRLLFGWMKVIPGVNKYFLKQEAKIKTDEILEVKEEMDQAKGNEIDL